MKHHYLIFLSLVFSLGCLGGESWESEKLFADNFTKYQKIKTYDNYNFEEKYIAEIYFVGIPEKNRYYNDELIEYIKKNKTQKSLKITDIPLDVSKESTLIDLITRITNNTEKLKSDIIFDHCFTEQEIDYGSWEDDINPVTNKRSDIYSGDGTITIIEDHEINYPPITSNIITQYPCWDHWHPGVLRKLRQLSIPNNTTNINLSFKDLAKNMFKHIPYYAKKSLYLMSSLLLQSGILTFVRVNITNNEYEFIFNKNVANLRTYPKSHKNLKV